MTRATPGFFHDLRRKYHEDHVSILVSSLAYFTFFSFFPMLLLLGSIIGFVYGMGEEYARLPRQLLGILPFSSEYMANALDRIIHARRSLGFFGSVLLIWSATAAFDNLQQILNRIHRAPAMRPLWSRRLLGLLLGLILMFFIPLSFGIAALRPLIARTLMHPTLPGRWEAALLTLCMSTLGIAFNFALLLTLYLFGPSVRRHFPQTWAGALTGAVLWEISKSVFGIYVRSLSSYKMLYGSVGSVIAVLLWLYVSGTIFALGAEVNFVLAARRERRSAGVRLQSV
jgi:membrane protein